MYSVLGELLDWNNCPVQCIVWPVCIGADKDTQKQFYSRGFDLIPKGKLALMIREGKCSNVAKEKERERYNRDRMAGEKRSKRRPVSLSLDGINTASPPPPRAELEGLELQVRMSEKGPLAK